MQLNKLGQEVGVLILSIFQFIKNIFTAYKDYKNRKFLRFVSTITTWLSILVLLISFLVGKKIFTVEIEKVISDFINNWKITYSGILILFYNYIVFLVKEKGALEVNSEIKTKIRTLLQVLYIFLTPKTHCRVTFFIYVKNKGKRCARLIPVDRICHTEETNLDGRRFYFKKNEGVPGKAWNDAWDGTLDEDLLDKMHIEIIPEDILENIELVKKYYLEHFSISTKLFEKLSEKKYSLKSYLGIGITKSRTDPSLGAVIIFDSTDEQAFNDLVTLKQMQNESAKSEGGEEELHISGASYEKKEGSDSTDKPHLAGENPSSDGSGIVEFFEGVECPIPDEVKRLIASIDEVDEDEEKIEIIKTLNIIFRKKWGSQTQEDIEKGMCQFYVYSLGLILKLLQDIIASSDLEEAYEERTW